MGEFDLEMVQIFKRRLNNFDASMQTTIFGVDASNTLKHKSHIEKGEMENL